MLTVSLVYPFCGEERRSALKQRWSLRLLHQLGIDLKVRGAAGQGGLVVANHISFIDILAINAALPATFVAKDDIRRWPLIGWLCRHSGTLFLERGSRSAAQKARAHLTGYLQAGHRVAFFPEGTTTRGDRVLPFHSALFQSAIDSGVDVQPVSLRYEGAQSKRSEIPAYVDDITLLRCLWSIVSVERTRVHVNMLPAIASREVDRRHLSSHAHRAIARHLGHSSGG
ncbi:MAG: 1-acyl-sn-glycerol-3-phosphate acyltransferase [Proteobacteria bacterium]|nr:1-acyl-sn-glycerol-3-phosphate acyltransferase [Pseudomonadota bacterium]HQR03918.1 lysophospholipid acyltransferase family protein [Rhodocyclaceae bacterium]